MAEDPYKQLEIESTATADEVRAAYYRLVRTHHPDLNLDDPQAIDRFKQIQRAYEALSRRRARPRRSSPIQAEAPADQTTDFRSHRALHVTAAVLVMTLSLWALSGSVVHLAHTVNPLQDRSAAEAVVRSAAATQLDAQPPAADSDAELSVFISYDQAEANVLEASSLAPAETVENGGSGHPHSSGSATSDVASAPLDDSANASAKTEVTYRLDWGSQTFDASESWPNDFQLSSRVRSEISQLSTQGGVLEQTQVTPAGLVGVERFNWTAGAPSESHPVFSGKQQPKERSDRIDISKLRPAELPSAPPLSLQSASRLDLGAGDAHGRKPLGGDSRSPNVVQTQFIDFLTPNRRPAIRGRGNVQTPDFGWKIDAGSSRRSAPGPRSSPSSKPVWEPQ